MIYLLAGQASREASLDVAKCWDVAHYLFTYQTVITLPIIIHRWYCHWLRYTGPTVLAFKVSWSLTPEVRASSHANNITPHHKSDLLLYSTDLCIICIISLALHHARIALSWHQLSGSGRLCLAWHRVPKTTRLTASRTAQHENRQARLSTLRLLSARFRRPGRACFGVLTACLLIANFGRSTCACRLTVVPDREDMGSGRPSTVLPALSQLHPDWIVIL